MEKKLTKYFRAVYETSDGNVSEEVYIASDETDARVYAEKNRNGRALLNVIAYQCFEDALLS